MANCLRSMAHSIPDRPPDSSIPIFQTPKTPKSPKTNASQLQRIAFTKHPLTIKVQDRLNNGKSQSGQLPVDSNLAYSTSRPQSPRVLIPTKPLQPRPKSGSNIDKYTKSPRARSSSAQTYNTMNQIQSIDQPPSLREIQDGHIMRSVTLYRRALDIWLSLQDWSRAIKVRLGIAQSLRSLRQWNNAENELKMALENAREHNLIEMQFEIFEDLSSGNLPNTIIYDYVTNHYLFSHLVLFIYSFSILYEKRDG